MSQLRQPHQSHQPHQPRQPTKPDQTTHFEDVNAKREEEAVGDPDEIDVHDVAQNRKLNRRLDLRVLPLCCWVYLLNFLDRGTASLSCTFLSSRLLAMVKFN